MHKLPMTKEQAEQLVANGHMTPETHAEALAADAYIQHFDEGGEVQPAPPAEEVPAWQQNNDPAMGITQVPQQDAPFTVDGLAQAMGPNLNAQVPGLQGATVASNDPNADKALASDLLKQQADRAPAAASVQGPQDDPAKAQKVEPGHVPTNEIGLPPQANAPQQGGAPIPGEDYYKKLDDSMAMQRKGTADAINIQSHAAQQAADVLHTQAEQMRREAALDQIHEWDRQQAASDQLDLLKKESQELASGKIDPNHFWATRSTGQKIAAAIGIALGGIGGGLSGHGGNAAMDVINKAIDRDMDAQKANLNIRQQQFQNNMGLYNMTLRNHQDQRSAELAHRSLGLQIAEMQVKQVMAQSQSPLIQANGQATLGLLDQQQQQLHQQLAFQGYKNRLLQQMGGPTGGMTAANANPETVRMVLGDDYANRLVPGVGFAKDKEQATKVQDFKGADDAFQTDLQNLKDFAKQNRGTTLSRSTVNKGKAMAAALQNSYRKAESMGVYKESEAEFMKNLIGADPTTFYNYVPQLEALEDSAKSARDAFYKAHIPTYRSVKEGAPRGR